MGLLVADMATAAPGEQPALTGSQALAWASTSNGDSDSIACIAGALIGAAHTEPTWWQSQNVHPRFEERYERALTVAVA